MSTDPLSKNPDPSWWDLKYLPRGRCAHLVHFGMSACGVFDEEYYWHGTGSQDEREMAERLSLCKNCSKLVTNRGESSVQPQEEEADRGRESREEQGGGTAEAADPQG